MSNLPKFYFKDIPAAEMAEIMDEIVAYERAREAAERCPVCGSLQLESGVGAGETKVKEYVACRDCKALLAWG